MDKYPALYVAIVFAIVAWGMTHVASIAIYISILHTVNGEESCLTDL